MHFPNAEICGFLEVSLKISVAYSNGYKRLARPISLGHDLSLWEDSAHTNHDGTRKYFYSCVLCSLFSFE